MKALTFTHYFYTYEQHELSTLIAVAPHCPKGMSAMLQKYEKIDEGKEPEDVTIGIPCFIGKEQRPKDNSSEHYAIEEIELLGEFLSEEDRLLGGT